MKPVNHSKIDSIIEDITEIREDLLEGLLLISKQVNTALALLSAAQENNSFSEVLDAEKELDLLKNRLAFLRQKTSEL